MSDQAVAPGQILAGKYRIDRVLGAGAMGLVLAATHLVLGSRVAIKVMLGGGKKGPELEERFLREARVASMLRSEHAAKVLDVGLTEEGAPYIVMEYLEGKDLGAVLSERGPLPVAEAVTYVLQACEAIAEAHALCIVHRDIKPANLFLTTGVSGAPCVKVVDFGIAKQVDGAVDLTSTGAILGSPLYMSPEQLRGSRDVDERADIWALGVTLYQLLAGITPFHADTLMAVVSIIGLEPPRPLAQYRADVPASLVAVILQCLEKDRTRRWPNVAAFANALVPHATAASAMYGDRVAKVQKANVAPSRPTDLLPPEPKAAEVVVADPRARELAPSVSPGAGARAQTRALVIGLAVGLGLTSALFFGLRPRTGGPEDKVQPQPEVSVAPVAVIAATTASATTPAVVTAAPSSTAPPVVAPGPTTAAGTPTPRAKSTAAAKTLPTDGFPGGLGSRR